MHLLAPRQGTQKLLLFWYLHGAVAEVKLFVLCKQCDTVQRGLPVPFLNLHLLLF